MEFVIPDEMFMLDTGDNDSGAYFVGANSVYADAAYSYAMDGIYAANSVDGVYAADAANSVDGAYAANNVDATDAANSVDGVDAARPANKLPEKKYTKSSQVVPIVRAIPAPLPACSPFLLPHEPTGLTSFGAHLLTTARTNRANALSRESAFAIYNRAARESAVASCAGLKRCNPASEPETDWAIPLTSFGDPFCRAAAAETEANSTQHTAAWKARALSPHDTEARESSSAKFFEYRRPLSPRTFSPQLAAACVAPKQTKSPTKSTTPLAPALNSAFASPALASPALASPALASPAWSDEWQKICAIAESVAVDIERGQQARATCTPPPDVFNSPTCSTSFASERDVLELRVAQARDSLARSVSALDKATGKTANNVSNANTKFASTFKHDASKHDASLASTPNGDKVYDTSKDEAAMRAWRAAMLDTLPVVSSTDSATSASAAFAFAPAACEFAAFAPAACEFKAFAPAAFEFEAFAPAAFEFEAFAPAACEFSASEHAACEFAPAACEFAPSAPASSACSSKVLRSTVRTICRSLRRRESALQRELRIATQYRVCMSRLRRDLEDLAKIQKRQARLQRRKAAANSADDICALGLEKKAQAQSQAQSQEAESAGWDLGAEHIGKATAVDDFGWDQDIDYCLDCDDPWRCAAVAFGM